jgi:hypothetical protein
MIAKEIGHGREVFSNGSIEALTEAKFEKTTVMFQ